MSALREQPREKEREREKERQKESKNGLLKKRQLDQAKFDHLNVNFK